MRRLLAALLVLAGGLQVRAEEHGMPRRAAPPPPDQTTPPAPAPRGGAPPPDAGRGAAAPARGAPARERPSGGAPARRYANDNSADLKALAADYKNAMGEVVRRYPDDLDAATLYAESAMDLHPWQLWQADGTPTEGTEEITAVLESVLKRDPLHPGANHYYVHAVEASPHPERALPSAARLETLVPGAGHLVHMPAHIYMRTGDYLRAAQANERAVEADRAYVAEGGHEMYALMYYAHDFHFMAAAYAMAGRGAGAQRAAGGGGGAPRAEARGPAPPQSPGRGVGRPLPLAPPLI